MNKTHDVRIRSRILQRTTAVTAALAIAAGLLLVSPAAVAAQALGPACYQNQFVIDPGTTSGASAGTFAFTESTLETASGEVDYGPGAGQFAANLKVTGPNSGSFGDQSPGGISGSIVAVITWANGTQSTFISRCVAEVSTEETSAGGAIEMEAEGLIIGFPGLGFFPRRAVASLGVTPDGDTGGVAVSFSVETGSTCFEPDVPEFSTVVEGGAFATISANNADVGRWGFPNGFNPDNCPDASA